MTQTIPNIKRQFGKTIFLPAIILIFSSIVLTPVLAQTKIGGTSGAPDANAYLQLGDAGAGKGLLLPRIELSATNLSAPLTTNVAGMYIYNTKVNGSGSTAVTPGVYVNDGNQWRRMFNNAEAWTLKGNTTTDTAANFIGTNDAKSMMFRMNNVKSGIISLQNTAFGFRALQAGLLPASGQRNTAFGSQALAANTSGADNTAIGAGALTSNTTASFNTAIGYGALNANTTGTDNTAIGYGALNKNNTASKNTVVGGLAMANSTGVQSSGNTGAGYLAMQANTTGANNVFFGSGALGNSTTGMSNIAFGFNADKINTTGNLNIAFGVNIATTGSGLNANTKNILIGTTTTPSPVITPAAAGNYLMNIGNTIFGTQVDSTTSVGKIGVNAQLPATTADVRGSLSRQLRTIATGTAYLTAVDDYYLIVKTGGGLNISLPSAAAYNGRELVVRAAGSSTITINATGGDGIDDGSGTFVSSATGNALYRLVSDGVSTWVIL
jgi:hypothetical protein